MINMIHTFMKYTNANNPLKKKKKKGYNGEVLENSF